MANGVLGVSPRSMKDTEQLQAMIDRGDEIVYVPAGDYVAEQPIRLRSDLRLVMDAGVSISAAEGAFKGKNDCLFVSHRASVITLQGSGAVLRMRKADYMDAAKYERSEHRHIFDFRGAQHVLLAGLYLENAGGDGVRVGCTEDGERVQSFDVNLHGLRIVEPLRNAVSLVGGSSFEARDCEFYAPAGGPGLSPQAAVDFEPNDDDDHCEGRLVRCLMVGNRGPALCAGFKRSKKNGPPRVMVLEDCTWSGFPWRMVNVWNETDDLAGFPHRNLAPGSLISINGQELLRV